MSLQHLEIDESKVTEKNGGVGVTESEKTDGGRRCDTDGYFMDQRIGPEHAVIADKQAANLPTVQWIDGKQVDHSPHDVDP